MANPAWPAPTITVSVHCISVLWWARARAAADAAGCGNALLIRGFDLDSDGRSVGENVEDSRTRASLLNGAFLCGGSSPGCTTTRRPGAGFPPFSPSPLRYGGAFFQSSGNASPLSRVADSWRALGVCASAPNDEKRIRMQKKRHTVPGACSPSR